MTAAPIIRSQSATRQPPQNRAIDGRSPAIERLRERAAALTSLRVSILIQGEVGTGRARLASAIHQGSNPDAPVRTLDASDERRVAATPDERKAYLVRDIERMNKALQIRWREIIRQREAARTAQPRCIATATKDLRIEAQCGRFDSEFADLLTRFTLVIPPLRDRREDIVELCAALAESAGQRLRGSSCALTPGAARLIAGQPWPGNVRELEAFLEKLVAFFPKSPITRPQARSLLGEVAGGVQASRRSQLSSQRTELVELIEATGGNLAEVARRLGMSRGGVIYRAQKYGLLPGRGR